MSAMIYDTTEQAFVEAETPMKFDQENQSWADTTGLAYNPEVDAWEEKWGNTKITLEGALEDSITVKDSSGNIVGVCTFDSGKTTGTISLTIPSTGGTYTFTSSVSDDPANINSKYSKTVTITPDTTNVKVMPDGLVLYWYGNECVDVTGGWYVPDGYQGKKYTNYFESGTEAGLGRSVSGAMFVNKMININGKTVIHGIHEANTSHCGILIKPPVNFSNILLNAIISLSTDDNSQNKHAFGYYKNSFSTSVTECYCCTYTRAYNNECRYNRIYAIYLT